MTKNQKLFNMIVKSRAIKQYVDDINFNINDEFILKLARNMDGITKHMMFKVFKEVTGITNRQKLMDIYYNKKYRKIDPIPHPFKSGDLVRTFYGVGVIMNNYPIGCWKTFDNCKSINVHMIQYPLTSHDPNTQEITHASFLDMEFYDINKIKDVKMKNNAMKLIAFYKSNN